MRNHVNFPNRLDSRDSGIGKVREFSTDKPFRIKLDDSQSLRAIVRDLVKQALDRQTTTQGRFVGALLRHLVGATLGCALGSGRLAQSTLSTANAMSDRNGDFFVGDVAIHVVASPGEAIIERCANNLKDGFRPIVVSLEKGAAAAEAMAEYRGIHEQIDVFEIEQFVALNLYKRGSFAREGRKTALMDLVERYNEIIDEVESDRSLRIDMRRQRGRRISKAAP